MSRIGGNRPQPQVFQDPMVQKLGKAEAENIPCPVIRTLINEDLITPDADGLVSTDQLNEALKTIGVGAIPRAGLIAGVPKVGDQSQGLLSRLFGKSEQNVNVYDLFNGPIDHGADTQVLRGGFNQERFDLLKSFSSDGKTLSIKDFAKAQSEYLKDEPGFKNALIGSAELTALTLVFGKPNAAGDRALDFATLESLFKDNKLPEGFERRNTGMLKLLGGLAKFAFSRSSSTAVGRSQMGLQKALGNQESVDQSSIKGMGAALCPVNMQPSSVQATDQSTAISPTDVMSAHSQMGVAQEEPALAGAQ